MTQLRKLPQLRLLRLNKLQLNKLSQLMLLRLSMVQLSKVQLNRLSQLLWLSNPLLDKPLNSHFELSVRLTCAFSPPAPCNTINLIFKLPFIIKNKALKSSTKICSYYEEKSKTK